MKRTMKKTKVVIKRKIKRDREKEEMENTDRKTNQTSDYGVNRNKSWIEKKNKKKMG